MIKFKAISYKNFQSVGNQGISIDLCKSPTTMVSGHNGAGKSNLLEALSYVLFGKSLKKVNLGGLINTINKKNLLVTLDFDSQGHTYKVIRGQKPGVFELYKDDELLDQNAASKDYQQKLESIIGMDHKMFTQMIVLNKERYVPFLELSAGDRRKIVEDILDISVFSAMNDQLKDEMKKMSVLIRDATYELERATTKVTAQNRLISESSGAFQDQIDSIMSEVTTRELEVARLTDKYNLAMSEIEDTVPLTARKEKIRKISQELLLMSNTESNKLQDHRKTLRFLDMNDTCPTCNQGIDETFKTEKHTHCTSEIDRHTSILSQMDKQFKSFDEETANIDQMISDIQVKARAANGYQQLIQNEQATIKSLARQCLSLSEKMKANNYKDELVELIKHQDVKEQELNALLSEEQILLKCKDLLKDDAIKASVVRDYILFINTRVNEYLNAMEFYINIRLDENFNEKIEAVNREGFTYDNLSTGQKCRVSLAICLALSEVAGLKNSVVTNVLFLDEILEPLDQVGVSLFMKLVREKLAHKNVFVITQRSEEFADYFRSEIKFKLNEGFTEMC